MKKTENRGRKILLDEKLSETICFHITKSQKKKLEQILKENNVGISTFLRGVLFTD